MPDLIGMMQAAAGNAEDEALYVEDVFSTYLYEGNGSTQTITNGVDLGGGGLVWIKNRDATDNHVLTDTARGATEILASNTTAAEATDADTLTAFNSDGFATGADVKVNTDTEDYVSWTFRKAPKFFDVVTYTGTGSARTVSHNLGSVPGCIIVKRTDSTGDWIVYHRSNTANPETDYLELNDTAATADDSVMWNNTAPTSTEFTVGTDADVNGSTNTYVAYLFAHNDGDGEFGEDEDQDVIKCGSYTGTGSAGNFIDLGFEPQWVMIKNSSATGNWWLLDVMRGASATSSAYMFADTTAAESSTSSIVEPKATGFNINNTGSGTNTNGATYVYIAIRRGPMKTPEDATEVFAIGTAESPEPAWTSGFPVDMSFNNDVASPGAFTWASRLNSGVFLRSDSVDAEASNANYVFDYQDGFFSFGFNDADHYSWMFRRAPGFFDVVAYTGTGANRTVAHNLGVVPELIIVKNRDAADAWQVYAGDETDYLVLNTTAATADNVNRWNDTAPTTSAFTIGTAVEVNTSTEDYIAYLFATLPGISKVGSYTGNGSSQTIDCGFSAGARFVMTKRVNTTGNWNVWDSERGIVAGNDPRLEFNTNDTEDTGHDYIDPDSSGFIVNYVADDNDDSNVSGDEYIFLAIA